MNSTTDAFRSLDARRRELLHELVAEQARRTPDAVAVTMADRPDLTYGELVGRARALGRQLTAAGVGPEVLVGVSMRRGPELLVALLAVAFAGGAYVPLDPAQPADRLAMTVDDAHLRILLLGPGGWAGGDAAAGPESLTVLDVSHGEAADGPCGVSAAPGNTLYVMYTSGSTGRPKGVSNSHAGVTEFLRWMVENYPLDADSRVLVKTPFGFDVSVMEIFWPLICGARLVLAHPEGHHDPAYLAEVVVTAGITEALFVPTQLSDFLAEPAAAGSGALRRLFSIGEELTPSVVERFTRMLPDTELVNAYGPTEAAIVTLTHTCVPPDTSTAHVPIGRPVGRNRAHVLAPRDLTPRADGAPGELFLSGPQVARGYHRGPGLTAERFLPNPRSCGDPEHARLYRTGDVVRARADGELEFLGREDRQVKVRGNRIELGDVEAALLRLAGVRGAEAARRTDPEDGTPTLVAWVAGEDSGTGGAGGLRKQLLDLLPRAMVPARIVTLDSFPVLNNGKLDRKALPDPFATAGRPAMARTAADPSEDDRPGKHRDAVMRVWGELLGGVAVGPDDAFFELGGDSALLLRVRAELRRLGYTGVRTLDLIEYATPARLGAFLAGRTDPRPPDDVPSWEGDDPDGRPAR
ncbi:non-ribosomal peptide synthetase [Streptomyces sp. AM 4-1-1]|uniref:non-ribosomal peptide synthetase n=1 Tax=Streptomyces sp. AM 4-1-1 TaxID=3028710 RepID=UPI0023B9B376|nr:non-ribosomal peptide synthetase [Streptomyces sp. AM 4-1-1]WEH36863.1 non-ribosomal peptide synthetase [Streptomyces sp. AM 4-1-1]